MVVTRESRDDSCAVFLWCYVMGWKQSATALCFFSNEVQFFLFNVVCAGSPAIITKQTSWEVGETRECLKSNRTNRCYLHHRTSLSAVYGQYYVWYIEYCCLYLKNKFARQERNCKFIYTTEFITNYLAVLWIWLCDE